MAKILIADDDTDIRNLIKILMNNDGHEVIEAANGTEAINLCVDADLILLDVMMPVKDGFSACPEIRDKTKAPIIFLTAKGQEYDKIIGFSTGADDYIVKPFVPSELSLRVNANLRRYLQYGGGVNVAGRDNIIRIGNLYINEDTCKVTVNDKESNLTATEYRILLLMCQYKGKVFSAKNIYESIWDDPQKPVYIKTVWGMGYKVEQ